MTTMIKIGLVMLAVLFVSTSALLVNALTSQRYVQVTPLQTPQPINSEEAKAIALRQIAGNVTETELASENGRAVYEIEVQKDGEHDVRIDAMTGTVLSVTTTVKEAESAKVPRKVTQQEAVEIARSHGNGTFAEVEMEREGNHYVYTVSFENGSKETEVKIDVDTGEVLSVETEYEDDDD